MCGGIVGDLIGGITKGFGDVFGDIEHFASKEFSDIEHFASKELTNIWKNDLLPIAKDGVVFTLDVLTMGGGQFDFNFGNNVYYNISGGKADDMRRLDRLKNNIDTESNLIKNTQLLLDRKVFLENAFKYVDGRKLKELDSEYTNLVNQYNKISHNIEKHQIHGFFEGILALPYTVTAGFIYGIRDYLETGNSKYIVQAIEIAVLTVVVILSVMAMQPGLTFQFVGLILAVLSATLTLDAMVNDSSLLGGVFQVLDLVLNKIIGLNNYLDTGGLNSHSKYYESNLMWTRMIIAVSAILTNIYTWIVPSAPAATLTPEAVAAQQSELAAKMAAIGSMKVVGTVTLSQIFEAYQLAGSIGAVADALKLKGELESKLKEAKEVFEKQVIDADRRKMQESYGDAEYIANQVDLVYSEYALQMSEQNITDIYDPEGTIAMNTRFKPQPKYTFGFEAIFNEGIQAGSDMYVYNILWRT
jgi:hypothetical protein